MLEGAVYQDISINCYPNFLINMRLFIALLMGCWLLSHSLLAQPYYKPAYIIELSGDTVFGKISLQSDQLMGEYCLFKDASNNKAKYLPQDLLSYRFIDGPYYIARELNGKMVFLEFLFSGKVRFYYLRNATGRHYYISKEDRPFIEMPYEEGIKEIGGRRVQYQSKQHIGILKDYMRDAPSLQARIDALVRPGHTMLIQLGEAYQELTGEGETAVLYEIMMPPVKILPEIVGGITQFPGLPDVGNDLVPQVGIIGHFWAPRVNSRVFVRTGLLYTKILFRKEVATLYRIPLQLAYIYPAGFFRPRFAYGLQYSNLFPLRVALDLGGNIKLSKSVLLSLTSSFEFKPNMVFFPEEYRSYTVQLGICYNL